MLSSAPRRTVLVSLLAAATPGVSCSSDTPAIDSSAGTVPPAGGGDAGSPGQPGGQDGSSPITGVDGDSGDTGAAGPSDAGSGGTTMTDGSIDSGAGADAAGDAAVATNAPTTLANPINIDYQFQTSSPSRKEAADPAIALYQDRYYLFSSQGHGYWSSSDLSSWAQIKPDWPTRVFQEWAPAAWTMNGALYFATPTVVYRTTDPLSGHWQFVANNFKSLGDPDYFVDDDGRLYAYYGLSNTQPPHGVQIDPGTFQPIGSEVPFFMLDPTHHGWEVPGDDNTVYSTKGWLEGTWMSKHNGVYYLQYACPGTEYVSYSDGVYTSRSPLGPFTYAQNNPFSTRLSGFSHSAGHSATFQDKTGNWWHVSNTLIGDKDRYERRLSIYPAGFDADGLLFVNTGLGDFPIAIPSGPSNALTSAPQWMLLSYQKRASASSTLTPSATQAFDTANAFDEDIKTIWSARTGNVGEWLQVDLGAPMKISAIQSNFAEQGSTFVSPLGASTSTFSRRYIVETSGDGSAWHLAIDRSASARDLSHDYVQLASPATARYVRITNRGEVPGGGQFSVRDFRIFGMGNQGPPAVPGGVTVSRNGNDTRTAEVSWAPTANAIGYLVRYGIAPDKLYDSRQVFGANSCTVNSLDVGVDYYFTVDSFNDSAVARGTMAVQGPAQP